MAEDTILQEAGAQAQGYPAEGSREMIDAGVFYGRKKSKTNPKMRSYVLTNRGGIEIINLQKTSEALVEAMAFVKEKAKAGAMMLFVGTEPAAEASILKIATKFKMPYVNLRWIGGSITNYKIISSRVDYLKKVRADLASGALVDKYTKKERLEMEREVKRLESLMGGLENLSREPEVLIMIDPDLHDTAVREAVIKKIPIVALANVDANPDVIDYLVPGNDKARKSIEWFLGHVEKAIEEGEAARNLVKAAIEAGK
jgi:small subunit ribosomal protein S2